MTDANGLYYMRARYYDPDVKRFVNADTYKGEISDSTSLNNYAYANGNPVTLTDPFGRCADDDDNYTKRFYKKYSWMSYIPVWGFGWTLGEGINSLISQSSGGPSYTDANWQKRMVWSGIGTGAFLLPEAELGAGAGAGAEATEEVGNASKIDFYVTPKGDAIPASEDEFYNNLYTFEENNGKYISTNGSNGPVRIRIEDAHSTNPDFSGENPYHDVPHIHIEYRKNGLTGPWGEPSSYNKFTFPQDWLQKE